ncbi:hypothetical protein GN244_ATG06990 [Phytophthora infestans]|uniref:Uncharacterized protein n=1 Tax=Phytophthora infestans TaxID=4787 RepID=A0A833S5D4_PHYIN|nr:hypothetical protein GN244_ATG06990 [Phytophthora infestans]
MELNYAIGGAPQKRTRSDASSNAAQNSLSQAPENIEVDKQIDDTASNGGNGNYPSGANRDREDDHTESDNTDCNDASNECRDDSTGPDNDYFDDDANATGLGTDHGLKPFAFGSGALREPFEKLFGSLDFSYLILICG